MKHRTGIVLIFATLVIAACGGKLEQRKQQVTIGITPNQEITLEPGGRLGLNAGAKAIDEPLTSMRWSVEAVSTPQVGPRLVIANANCTDVTLTIKDGDGIGNCRAELSVPADAEPMTWRIGATAESTSKGSASASFVVKVVAPERDTGNFRIDVPALVTTDDAGGDLYVNDLVSIDATALSDFTIDSLAYQWVLKSGQTVALAGANTNKLQFVPRTPGDYQFTLTASGMINSRSESVSADVLVIVGDLDPDLAGLTVFAGSAQSKISGDLVSLTGQASLNGATLTNPSFRWTQTVGPRITLANPTSPTPSFFAPSVLADTELVFRLDVSATDGGNTYEGSSYTVVRVQPPAPAP